jgi:hypothetical protein
MQSQCLDGVDRATPNDSRRLRDFDLEIVGCVEAGHGVASGKNLRSQYPAGTIALQYPFFKERGLDLGSCFPGTLNVTIAPHTFRIKTPTHEFHHVKWSPERKAENFTICNCCVSTSDQAVAGFVYTPDPSTKVRHYDDPCHLQIVSPFIPGVDYGTIVRVHYCSKELEILISCDSAESSERA